MLHGHAKIELTNVKTGETKVIEHDNYMTNWLADMLKPRGIYCRGIERKGQYSYGNVQNKRYLAKEELFGGVMLFENALTADAPNDYKFPPANKCVARGWEQNYAGTDLTVGFFNSGLSEIANDHATFVWDFTQERGNGTISALGLTNVWGARAGNGQDTILDSSLYVDLDGFLYFVETPPYIANNRQLIFYADMTNDIAYGVDTQLQSGKVRIYKYPLCYKNYNPITMNIVTAESLHDTTGITYTDVDFSSYAGNSFPSMNADDEGYLWVTTNGSLWNNGTSRTFAKYNWATGAITSVSVTNNTGYNIWMGDDNNTVPFIVHNGYMYVQCSNANRYAYIKIADNTDCGVMKYTNGNDIVTNGCGTGRFFNLWGDLYFAISGYNVSTVDASAPQMLVLASKGTATWRNLRAFHYGYYWSGYSNNGGGGDSAVDFYTWSDNNAFRKMNSVYNFMCLSTKNNLETPVTKTSDMTMRVTYTIREATNE